MKQKRKPNDRSNTGRPLYLLLTVAIVFPWALNVILQMETLLPIWTIA